MSQTQDFDILKAIYEQRESLEEYATRCGITRSQAEAHLAAALKRQKSRLTNESDSTSPHPDGAWAHLRLPRTRDRRIRRYLNPEFDEESDE